MPHPRWPRTTSLGARTLSEIPCLQFDCADGKIGNVDVGRFRAFGRQAARIKAGTGMMQFVAAPMWQGEGGVAAADARQRVR